ncbi:alpha/beta fold hydrolase [Mameliella alba]|nr:alpha/beta fold hydrolase [Antarctobacter heliothermus]MBY6145715.1 alpha/beta fold hydrolase [Mameliella alba]MCA0954868.1 alpha/beta fold hydrolase [Mameliella alba]
MTLESTNRPAWRYVRLMNRVLILFVLSFALIGCSPRGSVTVVGGFKPAALGASLQPVFVASDRRVIGDGSQALPHHSFGAERDTELRYGRLDISIPPVHQPGQIEWPRHDPPDPAPHFVTRSGERYANQYAFLRDIPRVGPAQDVVLFVHGFNVNNAEAVYRLAQIAHDYETDVPVISFSWPSAGDARGYVYDRDSVIFARDDLESLLTGLAADGRRILIVAHSMGGQLVMETLRQMSISGKGGALRQLSGVALISPDIDEDVFLRQSRRISPFPQPFMIMVSTRDRALGLAAFLTGKPSRLGSIQDPSRLGNLPVEIIDLSDIEGGDRAGHSTAFTAPAAIRLLRDLGGT